MLMLVLCEFFACEFVFVFVFDDDGFVFVFGLPRKALFLVPAMVAGCSFGLVWFDLV